MRRDRRRPKGWTESPARNGWRSASWCSAWLGILLLWWQLHREARIADQVRASEERFRGITQAALHPIVVTDDEGRITYWNDAAERTFGYQRYEVLEATICSSRLVPGGFMRTTRELSPSVPGDRPVARGSDGRSSWRRFGGTGRRFRSS